MNFKTKSKFFYKILILAIFLFFVTATSSTAAEIPPELLEAFWRGDENVSETPAQTLTKAPIDIREAIELTLSDNLDLRSLSQEIYMAEAFRLVADGTLTPTLDLNASTEETWTGSGNAGSNSARLSLNQTLYSGGRNQALRNQAEHVTSIADLVIIDAQNRAIGQLFIRFYLVLLQEQRTENEQAAIARSELHLREVTRMSELGLTNRLEVIRASQQLATNQADLVSAKGLYDAAVINLMNYMGIPPEERRPIRGTLREITVSGNREQSLAAAMENRADLSMLENEIALEQYEIEIARSGGRPRLNLGGTGAFTDQGRTGSFDDLYRAELLLTIPILDRNTTRANVIRTEAAAERKRISAEQRRLDIKSQVETAWSELETATEHVQSTAQALELAEETLRLAEVGYREGVTPQLDLLAAQMSLTESRQGHLRALYSHTLAVAALKVTEGGIINWAEAMEL